MPRETETEPATAPDAPAKTESPTEKYLRQIRNVVVAAFTIWIAAAVIGGIVWLIVMNNTHNAQAKARCDNNGGIYVNGQCI